MKLLSGIAWTSSSQLYMAAVAILIIPYLTEYFGAAQYGVVAFFLMLQSLLNLLDLGFSAAVSRDASKYKNGDIDKSYFLSVLFFFFKVFLLVTVVAMFSLFLVSELIVEKWSLQNVVINKSDLYSIVYITSIVLGVRMIATYFRSVMYGMSDFKWLAIINVISTTAKFVVAIPLMYQFNFDLLDYFHYQLMVQVFEFVAIAVRCNMLVGFSFGGQSISKDARSSVLKFAVGVGLSSIIWVLISNVDRLYTSTLLSLEELGYLHIAITLSGVVTVLTSPVMNAVVPKVTMLFSGKKIDECKLIYRVLSLFVTSAVLPVISISILCGQELLSHWFSNRHLAESIVFPLQLYLLGNFFLALASMSYPFSLADGRMSLRNISSITLLIFLVVVIPAAMLKYRIEGISITWAVAMCMYWGIWQPVLMKQISKNLFRESLRQDLAPAALVIIIMTLLYRFVDFPADYLLFIVMFFVYLSMVALSFVSAATGREVMIRFLDNVWLSKK